MNSFFAPKDIYRREAPRPSRKPQGGQWQIGQGTSFIPFHFTLASERCKSDMVKEAFALLAHIPNVVVHSNKSFANSIKNTVLNKYW
jgi:hypothetical protein